VGGDGATAGAAPTAGGLAEARVGPRALSLSDGTVLVVGGEDGAGDPVGTVERFDPAASRFEPTGASLPARAGAAYVTVEGARVVQVGGREGGDWSRQVDLLLDAGGEHVSLGPVLPVLESPAAAGLADGRVLVIGRDPATGDPRGVVLNPGTAQVDTILASRVPTQLAQLRDGSIASGDAVGLSLLRLDDRTPLDDPPATLLPASMEDRAKLAVDAPSRWHAEGAWLVADTDARLDVALLRFADFDLEIEVRGELDLDLTVDGPNPLAVSVGPDAVALGDCTAARAAGAPVRLTRAGHRLTLSAGGPSAGCGAPRLPPRVGIAVRASAGAAIRRLSLARQ